MSICCRNILVVKLNLPLVAFGEIGKIFPPFVFIPASTKNLKIKIKKNKSQNPDIKILPSINHAAEITSTVNNKKKRNGGM